MKDMNESTGEVAFYFAAFNKDLESDIILKTAYSKTFKENLPSFYHNRDHVDACGKPRDFGVDNKGAFCVSQLAIKTIVGNDVFEQYKAGLIKGHSQEFETLKSINDPTQKARIIQDLRLWGVTSVTNIPANLDTPTISIKSYQDITVQMKKINDILHKGNISDSLGKSFLSEYLRLKVFVKENKSALMELGVKYCQGCSTPMEDEEKSCPDCGKEWEVESKSRILTAEFGRGIKLF